MRDVGCNLYCIQCFGMLNWFVFVALT
uniref:Uncharacterized protein n=1 Tax=Rhizophora mucronata TaxID=61149 RepID=A0A2P2PME8_RHIMU